MFYKKLDCFVIPEIACLCVVYADIRGVYLNKIVKGKGPGVMLTAKIEFPCVSPYFPVFL